MPASWRSRVACSSPASFSTTGCSSGAISLRLESATFDETAHLPAGYTYLDRFDFRLNPEHPPLFKAWAALAPWAAGRGRPD